MTDTDNRTVYDILVTPEQRNAVRRRLDDLHGQHAAARERFEAARDEIARLDTLISTEQELAARFGIGRLLFASKS